MLPSFRLMVVLLAGASLGYAKEDHPAVKLGLKGYCPVCVTEMEAWEKGAPEVTAIYDGREYHFPNAEVRDKFTAAPEKYVPVLNGDCIVCYAKMGERVPGSVKFAVRHGGRVYLFPSDKERQMFIDGAAEFQNSDLAINGDCAVCLAKMKKQVPGKPEFTAIYNGLRFQFPSDKEKAMFLETPAEFAEAVGVVAESRVPPGKLISFTGRTGCAACEYGVKPLGAPNELGLAVTTAEDKVFVIEGAHESWPELYEGRFDHTQVSATGRVIKKAGKFCWIEPVEVREL